MELARYVRFQVGIVVRGGLIFRKGVSVLRVLLCVCCSVYADLLVALIFRKGVSVLRVLLCMCCSACAALLVPG